MIKQARQSEASPLVKAFADAIMAIGLHASLLSSPNPPSPKDELEAQLRLNTALESSEGLQVLPSSLLKLQATLLMVYPL